MATVLACSADPTPPAQMAPPIIVPPAVDSATLDPYVTDRLLPVSITVPEWDLIRNQTRDIYEALTGATCLDQPFDRPFTEVEANATVDGITVERVGVRKKGFYGSLSADRPSLKIDAAEWVKGRRIGGMRRLTLNNGLQDPSVVRQCLAYHVFETAGLPAPRCGFARVEVNGDDLGAYVSVEPVKKAFLRRVFGSDDGALWEGTLSDFAPSWSGSFEAKNTAAEMGQSALDAVTSAVARADDDAFLAAVEQVVDVDAFIRFWATEVLIGHWDGYAGDANNFYVYRDPGSAKLRFIPWGADAVFGLELDDRDDDPPDAVYAHGALARRLFAHPTMRAKYVAALRALIAQWDPTALIAKVDAWSALVRDAAPSPEFGAALRQLREFIRARPAQLQAELSRLDWPLPQRDPPCVELIGNISGEFDTTWGSHPDSEPFEQGTGRYDAAMVGGSTASGAGGSSAGFGVDDDDDGEAVIMVGVDRPDGIDLVYLAFDPELLAAGVTAPIDDDINRGSFLVYEGDVETFVGFLASGTLSLQLAGDDDGARIRGRLDARLYR